MFKPNDCCTAYLEIIEHFLCICEEGSIVWINDAGLRLMHAPSREAVLGAPMGNFVVDDFAELFAEGLELLAEEREAIPLSLLSVTGEHIDVRMYVSQITFSDGRIRHFVECQNITDLIRASQATRGREQRINAILEAVDQAIISIDQFGNIRNVNDVAVKIFGYDKLEMIGNNVKMLMPEPHRTHHDEYLIRYQSTGRGNLINQTMELEGLRQDGSTFPIELTVTEVIENDGSTSYVGSIRDITVQKAQEERIRFLALNDPLTGLPNRASFNDKIEEALARARRMDSGVALMFIDLDKFKPINDTYGHEAGDIVLKAVAERLNEVIRGTDTAARLGGDEFVLILENVPDRTLMEKVAKNILARVPDPIAIEAGTCSVGVSIGISHFPTDGDEIPELLSAADRAMYKVKEAGRNNYSFA